MASARMRTVTVFIIFPPEILFFRRNTCNIEAAIIPHTQTLEVRCGTPLNIHVDEYK
jgi:hypothetical protein